MARRPTRQPIDLTPEAILADGRADGQRCPLKPGQRYRLGTDQVATLIGPHRSASGRWDGRVRVFIQGVSGWRAVGVDQLSRLDVAQAYTATNTAPTAREIAKA